MTIKFAAVSPVAGLERYATLSKIHLVLAQHLNNREYFAFYEKMRDRGDEIILDNGAYENMVPLSEDVYWQCILTLQPTVAVLPDFLLQDARRTVSASLRFLDKYLGKTTTEWMFVPQAEAGNKGGIAYAIDVVLQDPRVGRFVSWVGLPRCLATHFDNWRPALAAVVRSSYPHIKLHALGMASGSVEEMKACEAVGVYSIDSSAPVYRGGFGLSISDPKDRQYWEEHGEDLRIEVEGTFEGQHEMIMKNLAEVGIYGS